MPVKIKIDPEVKLELLIKLAFGIPIEELAIEFDLTKVKIINLRKNNYLKYNEFFEHWRIDKEIAVLGFAPKYERAASIIKKFYKNKVKITPGNELIVKDKLCTLEDLVNIADYILQKDGIMNFKEMPIFMKNHY